MASRNSKKRTRKPAKKRSPKKTKAKISRKVKSRKRSQSKKVSSKSKGVKPDVIGIVTHYFPKVRAAVVRVKKPLGVKSLLATSTIATDRPPHR